MVEVALISKLLETKDYDTLKDKQITLQYFEEDYKDCIRFIDNYYMQHGLVPTVKVFKGKFPDIELEEYENHVGTEEPLTHWCDELRNKKTHNTIVHYLSRVAKSLDEEQVTYAVKDIRKLVNKIETELVETTAIDTTKDSHSRKERYEERKRNKGMLGIETGIKLLDYMMKGLQGKQLITLMARTATGKTWFYVLLASYMWLQGYKVHFFRTGMSGEQIEDRLEAMAMGMLYDKFDYNAFTSGQLDKEQEELYYKFLDRKESMETLIIDTATTVSAVRARVE